MSDGFRNILVIRPKHDFVNKEARCPGPRSDGEANRGNELEAEPPTEGIGAELPFFSARSQAKGKVPFHALARPRSKDPDGAAPCGVCPPPQNFFPDNWPMGMNNLIGKQ